MLHVAGAVLLELQSVLRVVAGAGLTPGTSAWDAVLCSAGAAKNSLMELKGQGSMEC